MTLKSNKNEPAVILESVCSVRTALSDLYLEQLLQNKPKSDKVRSRFLLFVWFFFYLSFFIGGGVWWTTCLLPGSREGGHMTGVLVPPPSTRPSKNRPRRVDMIQLAAAECADPLNKELHI